MPGSTGACSVQVPSDSAGIRRRMAAIMSAQVRSSSFGAGSVMMCPR
ncbi:hypothetical protein SBI_00495 [Streptomyces bingchenggensis BCW-1]|uniref:Uncharacterized protein n=1 Tax=Streptomyces bingchenggensis (strain BCW-1) TaxID=749414 RepID=D7C0C5_STRBB|nr:hypothetical protein SBI_00495 [Streptomyces bingchenggensis BCW-1]